MLQQTRVAAVIAHYHEFLRRFPTVEKLAAARLASVLAAWSGLGYYRRARMLHAAAKVVVREYESRFPQTPEELRALPGIGRYTAAAIASIAFGEPVAVVDGNVERVLQRVLGKSLAGESLWEAAEDWLDRKRPGDFNQAMMELGATVCTPRAPSCLTCPVVGLCATRGEMNGGAKAARQKKRAIDYALIYRNGDDDGEVFLVQRSRHASLMAGMWELPEILPAAMVTAGAKAHPQMGRRIAALKRCATRKQVAFGVASLREAKPVPHRPCGPVRNDITCWAEPVRNDLVNGVGSPLFNLRHSITVTDYIVRVWRSNAPENLDGKWTPVSRLDRMALTGLARKILRRAKIWQDRLSS